MKGEKTVHQQHKGVRYEKENKKFYNYETFSLKSCLYKKRVQNTLFLYRVEI